MTQVQTVSYDRGYGGYTLSSAQLAQLQTDLSNIITQDRATPGLGVQIYQDLATWLAAAQANNTVIDVGVLTWLQGAQAVNAGTNTFNANLIRDYTDDIYAIRNGSALSPTTLQTASNNIAISLAQDIIFNDGKYPSLVGLGADDAGAIASGVFGDVYSPWAGTFLFSFIESSPFYQDWVINPNIVQGLAYNAATNSYVTVSYKSVGGTYDLVASTEAYIQTLGSLIQSGQTPTTTPTNQSALYVVR